MWEWWHWYLLRQKTVWVRRGSCAFEQGPRQVAITSQLYERWYSLERVLRIRNAKWCRRAGVIQSQPFSCRKIVGQGRQIVQFARLRLTRGSHIEWNFFVCTWGFVVFYQFETPMESTHRPVIDRMLGLQYSSEISPGVRLLRICDGCQCLDTDYSV